MARPGHIFVSYARRDGRHHAERLERDLRATGLPVWRDVRDLQPNQDFSSELERAIEASAEVLCCITPDVKRQDSFVRRELQYSLMLGKPVIPLLFNADGWMPIHIATLSFIDFVRQTWDVGVQSLVARLNRSDPGLGERAALPADPYRDYLTSLYDQIVHYLDRTVLSLVELRGLSTPDAVGHAPRRLALPVSFFTSAGVECPTPAVSYPNFPAAFEAFGGRTLLLGAPGAGKTTTLLAYARECVVRRLEDPRQPLPLLLPIATWDAERRPALVDWIAAQIPGFGATDLRGLLRAGSALLMLDGLDELATGLEPPGADEARTTPDAPPPDARTEFVRRLTTDLAEWPAATRVIVTCRVKDHEELGARLPLRGAVTLQPLDDDQMSAYLGGVPALAEALQADAALREIARTPLLLSLFAHAYRDAAPQDVHDLRDLGGSPGELRDRIIGMFVRRSYEREARKPNAAVGFSLDDVSHLLGEIAVVDLERRGSVPHQVPAFVVKRVLGDEARVREFTDLTTRLFLFVQHTRAHYGFLHRIMRDFFASRHALSQVRHAANPAERLRALTTLRALQDGRARDMFRGGLRDPDPAIRMLAAQVAAETRDRQAIPLLLDGMADGDVGVRRSMVGAVGAMGVDSVADALVRAALHDDDPWVQLLAATGLRRLRHPVAFDALVGRLTESFWECRRYAAAELGRLGDPRAAIHLAPLLQDPSAKVRHAAAKALGVMGTPEAIR